MAVVIRVLRSALLVLSLACSASAFAGQTILFYHSQPGDYIGQGVDATFDTTSGSFSVITNYSNGIQMNFNTVNYSDWWMLNLAAPNNAPLQVGAYEGSQRWPFQPAGSPGLDFSGDGRGCNTSTGRFDVLEIVRDPTSGAVTQLAVNWEQHCEGVVPALFGQFRWNSNIPITRPLTINLQNSLNSQSCVEASSPTGALVTMNASDATDANGGTSLSFNWSSTTGDVGNASVFSFNAPLTPAATPIAVTLSVTDLTNNTTRVATKSICVSDTTGPTIVINSPTSGQVISGENVILDVTIKDAVDKNITQYEVLVGSDVFSPISPTTGHARQRILQTPQVNGTIATTITVRARDASGNTSQQAVTFSQVITK